MKCRQREIRNSFRSLYLFRILDVWADCSSPLPPVDCPHPSHLTSPLTLLLPLPSVHSFTFLSLILSRLSPLTCLCFSFPLSLLFVLLLLFFFPPSSLYPLPFFIFFPLILPFNFLLSSSSSMSTLYLLPSSLSLYHLIPFSPSTLTFFFSPLPPVPS